jgi:hypothetical protein
MISDPETENDKNNTEKGLEIPGNYPVIPPSAEAAEPSHARNQTSQKSKNSYHIVRVLKAVGHSIVWFINYIDSKGPFVTALATVAIAVLTWRYVRYSGAQWKAVSDQLPELRKSAKAAESASITASNQLEAFKNIEGAHIGVGQPQGVVQGNQVGIPLENYGRVPSPRV